MFAASEPSPSPPSRLVAEMPGPNGVNLCLAVDVKKPLQGPFAVQPSNSTARPHVAEGPFYPVVAASCQVVGDSAAALWSAGLDHELRVNVNGRPMCLSMRPMGAFSPLIDPFLQAFGAAAPNSPFAYLVDDLKPGGVVNARRADFAPELVAGACGASDAMDAWVYDDPSGTISGPAGPSWRRPCVTIHFDRRVKSDEAAPGAPTWAAYCRDSPDTPDENIDALDRALLPLAQRWRLETGSDLLPTYARRDSQDYFSGRGGLPIAGPMGRCLTADPAKNALFTTDCDGRVEQDWKYVDNQVRLAAKDLCLSAGADGSAALSPCGSTRNQFWAYTVRDGAANKEWLREEAFGELRPVDAPSKCLGVVKDPFADPKLALNPLSILDCTASEPRRISWFVTTNVQTVRVALVRFGHGSDHTPLPKLSDDNIKTAFELEIERLSQQFRRLGVRFVFDQQHDFRRVEDPIADKPEDGRGLAEALTKLAASDFYGKIMVALTERGTPGGATAWNVEYEPERIADPVSGAKFDYARWKQDAAIVLDKAGLPALSNFIDFGPAVVNLDTRAGLRQAQEFGHYFGLLALNVEPATADTPATPQWRAWIDAGAPPCGNLASLTINGRTFLPDRTNDESAWGCALGRSQGALTPMQLARASWTLRYQLNRLPLTACGPSAPYNADVVNCEDPESLALCKETSAYLQRTTGVETIACRGGGAIQRAIAGALKWVGVEFMFKSTPQGRALVNALVGRGGGAANPVPEATYDEIVKAFEAGKNPPLARALLNRISEIRDAATRDHNPIVDLAFTAKPDKPLAAADFDALKRYAAAAFAPSFIANVPAILK